MVNTTIEEMIKVLNEVPEDKRNLKIYVCDYNTSNNYEVDSITVFDEDAEHSEENVLGIDFKS